MQIVEISRLGKYKKPPKNQPTRDMLYQYHFEFKKLIKREKALVQHLVDDVLEISQQPKAKDLSKNLSVADLLNPQNKNKSEVIS